VPALGPQLRMPLPPTAQVRRRDAPQARPRQLGAPEVLTPQGRRSPRWSAEHLSNREIAARLFLSASVDVCHAVTASPVP
jgi:hypothetical protein